MKKIPVVFSGYNQRAVVAFLRTLEQKGLQYAVVASSKQDTIFLTEYAKNVLATRKQKALHLQDILDSIEQVRQRLKAERYVIAPSTEALNRYLLENEAELNKAGCELSIVDRVLYEKISDKQPFSDLCKSAGIAVPAEYEISEATYPYIAKPKRYLSADGAAHSPLLISNESDLAGFLSNHKREDFYYQEYIGGSSFYLLYYVYSTGEVVKLSQQNLMQQPDGKSIIAAEISDIHETDESKKYEDLLKSLNFHGLVMVEIRGDNEKYYMVEANPRFWGPSQLFVDAGMNLFEDFLFEAGITNAKPGHTAPKPVRYFWGGGLSLAGGVADYHDYSPDEFNRNISGWNAADIYNREDTKRLYQEEMSA